ncbi:MAG TPA: hypothetical protein VKM94_15450 [Blastocatellia bacterium]|nr:hypothetical protein [Blastocatellia bacterium]
MKVVDAVSKYLTESAVDASEQEVEILNLLDRIQGYADVGDLTPQFILNPFCREYVDLEFAELPQRRSNTHGRALAVKDSLTVFFRWAQCEVGLEDLEGLEKALDEVCATIPRAVEIAALLNEVSSARRGGFGFPEFLTSFEDGGRSSYDLDAPGKSGTRGGYFRVKSATGLETVLEHSASGELVAPVELPFEIATLISEGFILDLELLFKDGRWVVYDNGIVYPPSVQV